MTLAELMPNWLDSDGAAFRLGKALGVFEGDASFPDFKWIFWTDNPLGNGLHACLLSLVEAGVLEMNEDDQFRWAYVPLDKWDW
jgi:hypothetical protein